MHIAMIIIGMFMYCSCMFCHVYTPSACVIKSNFHENKAIKSNCIRTVYILLCLG